MEVPVINLTAQIVSAHLSANYVPSEQLAVLIRQVHHALSTVEQPTEPRAKPVPVVPAKRSVFPDHIVCMDCGKNFKMLKRHLAADHDMTPAQYRARWNLPPSYPVVAANYAAIRSKLAKDIGLGVKAPKAQTVPGKRLRRRKT